MSGAAGAHLSTSADPGGEPAKGADPDGGSTDGAPTPLAAATGGLCPRCGAKTLYDGWVRFAPRCTVCGLDFQRFDVGDGPAAFLTLIVGAVMVALALVVEVKWSPPLWLHMLLWTPLTIIGVIASLRIAKAALLALEYRHDAHQGRIAKDDR